MQILSKKSSQKSRATWIAVATTQMARCQSKMSVCAIERTFVAEQVQHEGTRCGLNPASRLVLLIVNKTK